VIRAGARFGYISPSASPADSLTLNSPPDQKRLPAAVAHEAGVFLLDRPGRREAARWPPMRHTFWRNSKKLPSKSTAPIMTGIQTSVARARGSFATRGISQSENADPLAS